MLFTSYFANAGKHPDAIAISQGTRGYPGIKTYKDLAPNYHLLKKYRDGKIDAAEFDRQFGLQLAKLDPRRVAAELPEGAILLCWEKTGEYCHRHQVASWLRAAGIKVEEHAPIPKEKKAKKATDPVQGQLL